MRSTKHLITLLVSILILLGEVRASSQAGSVFPPDKSQVAEADILVIFKTEKSFDPSNLNFELNNKNLKERINYLGNLAYFQITLQEGENQILVYQDGQVSQQVKYFFRKEAEPVERDYIPFRFHQGFINSDCKDCHNLNTKPFDFNTLVTSEEALSICLECHDDCLQAKYIHGPVGMGACVPCHDHHGSSKEAMLKNTGNKLCHTCHESARTDEHLDKLKKAKADTSTNCLTCHDSHGTEKKFHQIGRAHV